MRLPARGANGVPHWAVLAWALAVLNAWVTMAPIWPTPFVRLSGDLSIELAVVVICLVRRGSRGAADARVVGWLAVAWVALAIGRYAAVMSQSLWGRDINLYWDMPHVPAVGAMLAFVARPVVIATVVAAVVAVPVLVYLPARWAFRRVVTATVDPRLRRVMVVGCLAVPLLGGVQRLDEERIPQWPGVATPVTAVWARQVRQLAYEMSGAGLRALGEAPDVRSSLSLVRGADVIVVFAESYGGVSWTTPAFARGLAEARATLLADIRETGRDVVSTSVESPTFGGESWLAHVSLLSGTEVRDGATNARLLAQRRDTMVTTFSRAGYRTVALMPGLQRAWSEGAFYGFDAVYGAEALDYKGPPFGWWDINDQFAMARLDQMEIAPTSRAPLFAVFPTISTHTPFIPAPPYQPDWARMLGARPYSPEALDEAYAEPANWLDLSPGFVRALVYAHRTLGGFLRHRADRDLVLVVIGDHQPPALVSGEGASWDVPVHVIASRPAVLDRLRASGFVAGLEPTWPARSKMHALLPVLLGAFGDRP